MTQITRGTNCGNSPKNQIAEDIAVAIETKDTEFLSGVMDDDSTWNQESGTTATSEAILALVRSSQTRRSITVDCVISHGKVGMVNGLASYGKTEHRFCHVVKFTSVKCHRVLHIESYGG